MSIINKINNILNESGIRNIRRISKEYKEAIIYFHVDLDGVTSAIGMKQYLKGYGIKTKNAVPIQYGAQEYAIPKPKGKIMHVLVDFAMGKPIMNIHLDHHDTQRGVEKGVSTSFVKSPSNAAYISQTLSQSDLFPPQDAKMINTIDSADFAKQGITVADVMSAEYSGTGDVIKDNKKMALVVNTLLLAYKNKTDFLKEIVMKANPSLKSMYVNIMKLIKDKKYPLPKEVAAGKEMYVQQQQGSMKPSGSKIIALKSGESVIWGNTIVQYGGGKMFRPVKYDRYTPFKNYPHAHYLIIGWPMGLLQISKNPFKSEKNPYNLSKIADEVLKKFEGKLKKRRVPLAYIKMLFDRDASKTMAKTLKDRGFEIPKEQIANDIFGFTFKDFNALYAKHAIGIKGNDIESIMHKPYDHLSDEEKKPLWNITITLWDIVRETKGGHKDITNIPNLNFYGKGYVDALLKKMMFVAAKEMKDKELKK